MTAKQIHIALARLGNPDIAAHSRRFFKTGKGEYGEGDRFLGIRVPVLRRKAKEFKNSPLPEILRVLTSTFHEERLLALFMLVNKFSKGLPHERKEIYELYLKNTKYINNWDLVDSSAGYIVGAYLADKDKQLIYRMAGSISLWERRIAIMSTFPMIRANDFTTTLNVSQVLLKDEEDLIHKAVGWMLREIGKRNLSVEEDFLKKHYKGMPRTMLHYAIEKFPNKERKRYLMGLV
ncbi:MAG: DNA alkylation repair protein [Desulfobacterales bacterium]